MNKIISPEYAEINRKLHADHAVYGVGAFRQAPIVANLVKQNGYGVILDYGCGKGSLKPALLELCPELKVLEFDPAVAGKDELPSEPIDALVALDVMEHVEPDYLDAVLQTMKDLRPKAVLLIIATRPAQKTLPDGRNAHLIIQAEEWWLEKLSAHFSLVFKLDRGGELLYVGKPLN